MGKTWAKELSGLVEKLDTAYRLGNAKVGDKQFDQLKNRLKEIDPQIKKAETQGVKILRKKEFEKITLDE